ncbi:MAG: hypothetical protein LBR56_03800 [Sporomusaceae bacterium]|nr:hypothetical protein [Sporomusaceae bacterium]
MTADVSQTKKTDYTWDNASFNWENVQARKNWLESYSALFQLLNKEDIFFTEKSFRKIGLKIKDIISLKLQLTNSFDKRLKENILFSENYLDFINYILKVQEMLTFKEINPKTITRSFSETFQITAQTWTEYLKNISESLSFDENQKHNLQILKKNNLTISDQLGNHYTKIIYEATKLLDQSPYWAINKAILEDLTVSDCYQDFISYILRIQEAISFLEKPAKDVTIAKKEALQLTEHITKSALKAVSELFVLTDNTKSTNTFQRIFAETVTVVEKIAKTIGVTKLETLNIIESYLRNANNILSDLVFFKGDMTLDDFLKQTSSPIGYEPFKDMQVGEYEYQNALIRLIVEAGVLSVRPQITEWELNVDIPDTIDRGQAVIPASIHTVLFNKHYYEVPEVQISLKGASVFGATPSITAIHKDGFEVAIKDGSGNLISGIISWTATGY